MIFTYLNSLDTENLFFIFEMVLRKTQQDQRFFKSEILIQQPKNVDLKYYCPLVHSKIGNQPHKLFLLSKPTEHFAMMIGDRYNTFPFHSKDLFVVFGKVCSIFRFIYYPSLLVELTFVTYLFRFALTRIQRVSLKSQKPA